LPDSLKPLIGFGALRTDAEGRYKFKTIKPGAYPVNPNRPDEIRPPHIHFRLIGHDDELITQMYFEGDPLNDKDRFLQNVRPMNRDLLIAKVLPPTQELIKFPN
jgi:protocatechuate 3,4-dioxygenase beta subunit